MPDPVAQKGIHAERLGTGTHIDVKDSLKLEMHDHRAAQQRREARQLPHDLGNVGALTRIPNTRHLHVVQTGQGQQDRLGSAQLPKPLEHRRVPRSVDVTRRSLGQSDPVVQVQVDQQRRPCREANGGWPHESSVSPIATLPHANEGRRRTQIPPVEFETDWYLHHITPVVTVGAN